MGKRLICCCNCGKVSGCTLTEIDLLYDIGWCCVGISFGYKVANGYLCPVCLNIFYIKPNEYNIPTPNRYDDSALDRIYKRIQDNEQFRMDSKYVCGWFHSGNSRFFDPTNEVIDNMATSTTSTTTTSTTTPEPSFYKQQYNYFELLERARKHYIKPKKASTIKRDLKRAVYKKLYTDYKPQELNTDTYSNQQSSSLMLLSISIFLLAFILIVILAIISWS